MGKGNSAAVIAVKSEAAGELTAGERKSLAHHETTISDALKSFVETGNALAAIRQQRLHRETHDSFDAYVRDRWGFQRAHAYRLIASAEVVADVLAQRPGEARGAGRAPAGDREARPGPWPASSARSVRKSGRRSSATGPMRGGIGAAKKAPTHNPTAEFIEAKVRQHVAPREDPSPPPAPPPAARLPAASPLCLADPVVGMPFLSPRINPQAAFECALHQLGELVHAIRCNPQFAGMQQELASKLRFLALAIEDARS